MSRKGNNSNSRNAKYVMEIVSEDIRTEVIKKTLKIHENLMKTTPVDTGFAVNNWIPAIAIPFGGVAGSPEKVSGSESGAGVVNLLSWNLKTPAYITNNVNYVEKLNEGSSKQAPAGFIEKAIQGALI